MASAARAVQILVVGATAHGWTQHTMFAMHTASPVRAVSMTKKELLARSVRTSGTVLIEHLSQLTLTENASVHAASLCVYPTTLRRHPVPLHTKRTRTPQMHALLPYCAFPTQGCGRSPCSYRTRGVRAMVQSDTSARSALLCLLVQRAVQHCCYTARSCRDAPTAQWLGSFGGLEGVETLHGIDALRATGWRQYLASMLRAPAEEVVVHSVLKRHRGVSPSNPYLQPSPMTYTHEVQPSALAERVMSAALLIASEWEEDFALIAAENEEQWRRHMDAVQRLGPNERATRLPVFTIDQDASQDSPYRGGNYDLLKALLTREAAAATLRDLSILPSKAAEAKMLREALNKTFVGELSHHAADTFLARLLELPFTIQRKVAPRSAISSNRCDTTDAADEIDGPETVTFVDPLAVAGQVMEARKQLALEMVEELRGVSQHFLQLKREWLAELAGVNDE